MSVDYWAPGMGAPKLADFWDPYFSTAATPDGSRAYELAFIADHGDPPDTLEVAVAHALEIAVLAFNASQSTNHEVRVRCAIARHDTFSLCVLTLLRGSSACASQPERFDDDGPRGFRFAIPQNPEQLSLPPVSTTTGRVAG